MKNVDAGLGSPTRRFIPLDEFLVASDLSLRQFTALLARGEAPFTIEVEGELKVVKREAMAWLADVEFRAHVATFEQKAAARRNGVEATHA